MVAAFREKRSSKPVISTLDVEYISEIDEVDRAILKLLDRKRQLLREDPQREHVLHMRYVERLRRIKRHMDAICV